MRTQRTGERTAEGLKRATCYFGLPRGVGVVTKVLLESRLEGHTSALGETSNKVTVRGRRTTQ